MKRLIKFRGRRTDNQEWIYGHLVVDPNGKYRIYLKPFEEATSNTFYFVDPETVGQFTGLVDKNGKEIYEGDVVKYYQPYAKIWDTHFVKWDDLWACFGLFEINNEWCKENDWMKIGEIEIIGNIIDNPEMLER